MNDPIQPEKIRQRCLEYAARPGPTSISQKTLNILMGKINIALLAESKIRKLEVDKMRHCVIGYIFNNEAKPMSSKELAPQQAYALMRWAYGASLDQGHFDLRETFHSEVQWIFSAAELEGYNDDILLAAKVHPSALEEDSPELDDLLEQPAPLDDSDLWMPPGV